LMTLPYQCGYLSFKKKKGDKETEKG